MSLGAAVSWQAVARSRLAQVHIKFILSASEKAGVFTLGRYPQQRACERSVH